MAAREDDTATVILTTTELKPPVMNSQVEEMYNKFTVFKSLPKTGLEIKGLPDHKQYMFILQLLSKEESLCHWESFPITASTNKDKEQSGCIWEAFEVLFRQTSNFKC